jgi:hypothetical protein
MHNGTYLGDLLFNFLFLRLKAGKAARTMSGCKEVDLLMLSGLQVLVVGLHFRKRMAQSTSETLLKPAQLLDPRPHLAVLIPVVPKLWSAPSEKDPKFREWESD